jgi:hypothetical protein
MKREQTIFFINTPLDFLCLPKQKRVIPIRQNQTDPDGPDPRYSIFSGLFSAFIFM